MGEIAKSENFNAEVYKTAAHIIEAGFKEAGIKDGDEFKALAKLLTAKKMTVDKYGEEHWEDDNTAIRGGVELVLRLRRLLENKAAGIGEVAVVHKISPKDIERLEGIAAELKKLEERLSENGQRGKIIDVAGDITEITG